MKNKFKIVLPWLQKFPVAAAKIWLSTNDRAKPGRWMRIFGIWDDDVGRRKEGTPEPIFNLDISRSDFSTLSHEKHMARRLLQDQRGDALFQY